MAITKTRRTARTSRLRRGGHNGLPVRTRVAHPQNASPAEPAPVPGLRERKKVKLRQQIINTAIRLFRKHGYENTRVEDIVQVLEISQPTFFRYFPSKDAVVRDVGLRGIACITGQLRSELASEASTAEHLRRLYS